MPDLRKLISEQFTPSEDIAQLVQFVKSLIEQEGQKNELPGPFNIANKVPQAVAGGLVDTMADSTTKGGQVVGMASMLPMEGPLAKILAMLGKKRSASTAGDAFLREHVAPPMVEKPVMPHEFTAVGEEPMDFRPKFTNPEESIYERMVKNGGRTTPERRKPK
jgi:hypothetical protein